MNSFRSLHRVGAPLLLPNAWDVASALALDGAGFAAVGTTSLGVAAAAGLPDGRGRGRRETERLVAALRGRLSVPLTVDVEGGFGGGPAEVAELAAGLFDAGAVGINLEDGRAGRGLVEAGVQAELIAAVKERVPAIFVNARTDTHWLGGGDLGETLGRVGEYVRAGADGVFVPGVSDEAEIRTLASESAVPLNVLLLPGMTVAHLAGLGVARISTGSMLFRVALDAAVSTARAVAGGVAAPATALSYADVNRLG
jgi:2-methylisocitrate lyase-like PEP mutase family enzyme